MSKLNNQVNNDLSECSIFVNSDKENISVDLQGGTIAIAASIHHLINVFAQEQRLSFDDMMNILYDIEYIKEDYDYAYKA